MRTLRGQHMRALAQQRVMLPHRGGRGGAGRGGRGGPSGTRDNIHSAPTNDATLHE